MALTSITTWLISSILTLPWSVYRWFTRSEDDEDNTLLKKYGDKKTHTTSQTTYNGIRTFYHPHAHADKLQIISDLPLLIFIHGIGGSLVQFVPLLSSFVNIAPTFGIELPGHGQSDFLYEHQGYTFEALAELWSVAIDEICQRHGHREVVFVGHSFGCSIGASLATSYRLSVNVKGLIAICPKATPPTEHQTRTFRRLLSLPDFVLDTIRWFDRLGGENSKSVHRFVHPDDAADLKRLQLKFNRQFKTAVWKRISLGCLPRYENGVGSGGLPGREIWEKVDVPLFLVAGESDVVTKPSEVATIIGFVKGETGSKDRRAEAKGSDIKDEPRLLAIDDTSSYGADNTSSKVYRKNSTTDESRTQNHTLSDNTTADDSTFDLLPTQHQTQSQHSATVHSILLPSPASHSLLYSHSTYRTVAGLIEDFLSRHISPTLSLGWQLQKLTTTGKWDVKNVEKWKGVVPVSGPIPFDLPTGQHHHQKTTDGIGKSDGIVFRALKTLREQDENHSPAEFLRRWENKIYAVVDISHDAPVYDTTTLQKGGVQYYKFPTVSKIPPTITEVSEFIGLIDRLEAEISETETNKKSIGVHCHYGYNRTGFFIVCYLVEKKGWRLIDAIEEFARQKPPGIKHAHFVDTLFVRYTVGLRKSSIFVS